MRQALLSCMITFEWIYQPLQSKRWTVFRLRLSSKNGDFQQICERCVILSGPGLVEIGTEKPCDITTDDEVIVPANALERIKNSGENDLLFIAICSPRFQKKTIMRAQLVPLSRLSGARFPNRKALDRQIFICRLRRLKVSIYLFSPFRCLPGNTSS